MIALIAVAKLKNKEYLQKKLYVIFQILFCKITYNKSVWQSNAFQNSNIIIALNML